MSRCTAAKRLFLLLPGVLALPGWAAGTGPAPGIAVNPIAVRAEAFRNAPARGDEAALLERLSREATAGANRALSRLRINGTRPAAPAGSAPLVLMGTVDLPVSLPQSEAGGRALFRRGRFAVARVVLSGKDGAVLAAAKKTLSWNDVRWLDSAKTRRARKVESVLVDAVRRSVAGAVERLADELAAERPGDSARTPAPGGLRDGAGSGIVEGSL